MAKAQIANIVIMDGKATVTYSTGSVRRYSVDTLPGTVTAWMEAHPIEEAAGGTPKEVTETEATEETSETTTGFILIGGPAPEITMGAVEDAAQLPALISTEEAAEDAVKEETMETEATSEDDVPEVTGEAIKAQAIAEAVETASKVAKAAAKVAVVTAKATKAIIKAAPVTAVKAAGAFWKVAFLGLDLWYGATTWGPILGKRILFLLTWAALPAIKNALEAVKAPTLALINGVAGCGLMAILAGVRAILASTKVIKALSKATHKAVVSGWAMRKEIIHDMTA